MGQARAETHGPAEKDRAQVTSHEDRITTANGERERGTLTNHERDRGLVTGFEKERLNCSATLERGTSLGLARADSDRRDSSHGKEDKERNR